MMKRNGNMKQITEKRKGECLSGCVCSLYGKFVMFAVPNSLTKQSPNQDVLLTFFSRCKFLRYSILFQSANDIVGNCFLDFKIM